MAFIRNLGMALAIVGIAFIVIGLASMMVPIEKLMETLLGSRTIESVWYIACGCASLGAGSLMAGARAE